MFLARCSERAERVIRNVDIRYQGASHFYKRPYFGSKGRIIELRRVGIYRVCLNSVIE